MALLRKTIAVLLLCLLGAFPANATTHSKTHSKSHSKSHSKAKSKSKSNPRPQTVTKRATGPFSTVIIDAGHGGHDPGGIPQNIIPEKYVALDVALRLSKALRKAGFKTVLTRSDDTFISLPQRVAIANAHPDAVFVSIHFNAAPNRDGHGIETYYSSTSDILLARAIQRKLMIAIPTLNRGTKQASYYVLRQTKIRAVLAECGFLTNPQEAALARTTAYRQKLANQICAAVVEYRNMFKQ
ncbi:MAG: N-acetylmuramoyl-L-alanine amidase [Chthoniobacterales bacterium]